jgi:hypothetical protein
VAVRVVAGAQAGHPMMQGRMGRRSGPHPPTSSSGRGVCCCWLGAQNGSLAFTRRCCLVSFISKMISGVAADVSHGVRHLPCARRHSAPPTAARWLKNMFEKCQETDNYSAVVPSDENKGKKENISFLRLADSRDGLRAAYATCAPLYAPRSQRGAQRRLSGLTAKKRLSGFDV